MTKLILKLTGLFLVMTMSITSLSAQSTKKELTKELKSRIERDCRKEAKSLAKEGWKTMPGKLSIERQIQDGRFAEIELDELGEKVYFTSQHSSLGGNYSAAKKIASSRAIAELAEQVGSKVESIVENNVSQTTFSADEMELIDRCISASRQTVSTKLSGAFPVIEIYREIGNGKLEVKMMYQMNARNALRMTKDVYRKELERDSKEVAEKLDFIIDKF